MIIIEITKMYKICTSRILFCFLKRKSIHLKFLLYVLEFFFLFKVFSNHLDEG